MHVYAVALEKGGVGKSALSVNLAAAFARINLRVLLVDLDAQANATHWLGVARDDVRPDGTLLGLLMGRSLESCVLQTDEGISLLPAHPTMASLPVHISSQPNSGIFILKDVLARTTKPTPLYDVVILDLAPARGPVQATALAAATRCIAPVQPEDLVIKALTDLVETVAQAQRINPQLRGISIVRNKYTVRSVGDQAYDQLLRESYGDRLLKTIIPVRAALRDSPGLGQSVFRYNGSDAGDVRTLFLDLLDELMALDGGV